MQMKRRGKIALLVAVLAGLLGVYQLRRSTDSTDPATLRSVETPPPSEPPPDAAAGDRRPPTQSTARSERIDAESAVEAEAELVLHALQARNMPELARHVHPVNGLRFSPYMAVDPKRSVVLTAAELAGALENTQRRTWGRGDGSGDPISLTFARYYQRFIYDRDYVRVAQRRVNQFGDKSTTRPNIREIYPDAIVVEAHAPGTKPESEGMDWSSLGLVFEPYESNWYLSALVHDQWTI